MEQHPIITRKRTNYAALSLSALFVMTTADAIAQQKVYGNVFIPSGAEVTVFGAQDFGNNGKITTARSIVYGRLNVAESVLFVNANENSYINGAVKKLGTSPLVFPVGDGNFYGPFAGSAADLTGVFFHTSPTDASFPVTTRQPVLSFVNNTEYWQIEGPNATLLSLTWNEASALGEHLTRIDPIRIVGWKDGLWTEIPSKPDINSILGGNSSLTSGSVTSTVAIRPNEFEAFTIGASSEALPVTLADFNVKKELNTGILSWVTTSETNSDHFEIERSTDIKIWHKIGFVKSFVESSVRREYRFDDSTPVRGANYYRLKMVDADGTFAFSTTKSLSFESVLEGITLYPNPANRVLKILPLVTDPNRRKQISVTDLNGSNYDHALKWSGNDLNVEKLANGVYILTIPNLSGEPFRTRFVVQK